MPTTTQQTAYRQALADLARAAEAQRLLVAAALAQRGLA